MGSIPWKQEINFASALLLHSCITIILEELSNSLSILYRLVQRGTDETRVASSVVLDGYTSVFSRDRDGELAELYFTNTGLAFLMLSLSSSVAMNLLCPTLVLNISVATTFGLTFVASALVACRRRSVVMPIMALRRAGRFIWSDTPFVNFFSLIYIAVVLKGVPSLTLRDYITFRCIAILELLFMKANLAAADVETQQDMLTRLLNSEYIMIGNATTTPSDPAQPVKQSYIVPFTTFQRLSVMLYKTTIGHANGSLCGSFGPVMIPAARDAGYFVDEAAQHGWRTYRVSPNLLVLEDCIQDMVSEKMKRTSTMDRRGFVSLYAKFIAWSHGVLLRYIGRRRVVLLLRTEEKEGGRMYWRGHVNLVTGLEEKWLWDRSRFQPITAGCNVEVDHEIVR